MNASTLQSRMGRQWSHDDLGEFSTRNHRKALTHAAELPTADPSGPTCGWTWPRGLSLEDRHLMFLRGQTNVPLPLLAYVVVDLGSACTAVGVTPAHLSTAPACLHRMLKVRATSRLQG